MKFSIKLVVWVTAIVSIMFLLAGMIMLYQNFKVSLEATISQNINTHILERYAIEMNIINNIANGQELTQEQIKEYGRSLSQYMNNSSKMLGIYDKNKQIIFSNLPDKLSKEEIEETLNQKGNTYWIRKKEKTQYMLLSSYLEINQNGIYVISVYNISKIFVERDRQLQNFLLIQASITGLSALSIYLLAKVLTNPIKKLNYITKKIAGGSYTERADCKTQDEIGELGQSFNQMADGIVEKIEKLNDSVKQRDDFISSFTHEIKTPMTSIIGYSDFLRFRKVDEETLAKGLNYIYTESKRLESLSQQLMSLMGLSEETIEFKTIEIEKFLEQLKERIQSEIPITIEVEKAKVLGDSILLETLLRNLIQNAIRANPKEKEVKIIGKKEEKEYKIEVIDTGCGIPKQEIPRITEKFYRVDKARTKGGNGIGLAIAKKITDLHNTELYFESEEEKGTKVSFKLEVIDP